MTIIRKNTITNNHNHSKKSIRPTYTYHTSHQLFNNSNQLCSEWCMHLTQLSNTMWYHSIGNSLSMSSWHSHLGKHDNNCQGHHVVHRLLPLMLISMSLKGVPSRVKYPPSTKIIPREEPQVLTDKFILFPCNYTVWNMGTMNAPTLDSKKNSKQSPSLSKDA